MCFICNALCFYLLVILYAWYICAIIFNVVMSYDCSLVCALLYYMYCHACFLLIFYVCLIDDLKAQQSLCYLYCYVSSLKKAFEPWTFERSDPHSPQKDVWYKNPLFDFVIINQGHRDLSLILYTQTCIDSYACKIWNHCPGQSCITRRIHGN